MQIFLGYQNNGQAVSNLEIFHIPVAEAMRPQHEVFCALEAGPEFAARGLTTYDDKLGYCLEQVPGSDLLIAVIKVPNYLGGIEKEVEEAGIHSVPVIAAIQRGIPFPPFLEDISAARIDFRNQQQLIAQVSQY
jgi:hypothetical protein